jgi:nucleoside 2-deoxyribosyltransferase
MALILEPPKAVSTPLFTIFLAGSIEMGKAENWQKKFIEIFVDKKDLVILNPRRKDWDPNWTQSKETPQFAEQVIWELNGLERADLIVFYIDPATKSPITLMELGWIVGLGKKCVVCCPDGFWRKGNVDIFCAKNGIRQVENIEEIITEAQIQYSIMKAQF